MHVAPLTVLLTMTTRTESHALPKSFAFGMSGRRESVFRPEREVQFANSVASPTAVVEESRCITARHALPDSFHARDRL